MQDATTSGTLHRLPHPPPPPPPPPPPRRRRSGCLWGVLVLLVLMVAALSLLVLAIFAIKPSVNVPLKTRRMGMDEFPAFDETWAYGAGDTKVVLIPLRGIIMLGNAGGGFFSGISPTEKALLSIRRATRDRDVRAIILRIDSGGGGITASDILYKALLDFKAEDPRRRVVALFDDVAASGAYYISLAADTIMAHPTTITGSIGVLIQSLNAVELGRKIGIQDITIKSGKNKDLLNPLDEVSEEQRQLLQQLVNELHARFVELVAEGRDLPLETVRALADGRIYSARQAVELELVDRIGYWDDAMHETAELLGVDQIKVYRYDQGFSFSSMFQSLQGWDPVETLLYRSRTPRLLYLWTL